jgi:DNA-binding NarL/FixJ family response regulator
MRGAVVRVLLADDHGIVRDGLRWMLRDEPDIDIVAEASNGEELLDRLRDHPGEVDIVLLDIRMPGLGGLDALERLTPPGAPATGPAMVILSMHHEPFLVRRAIELGAAGYLLKSATRQQLLAALRQVAAGNSYLQAEVTGPLLDQVAGRTPAAALPTVTPREVEVLVLVAAGKANKHIAAELGIAEDTVKTLLKDVYARLRVGNRAEAVAKALQLGIIDPA